jgi:hypothetical protein
MGFSKNKVNLNKTQKRQKGGILLKMHAEKAFYFFINNSSVELLTDRSSFGIVLKLILNKGVISPYEQFNAANYKEPVDCILIKLVALTSAKHYEKDLPEWDYLSGETKMIDAEETFIKEVNIQTDIFFNTMQFLEPLCPAPVYSNIFKDKQKADNFIELLKKNTPKTRPGTIQILNVIKKRIISGEIPWLGVLGMEIASNYISLFKLKKESNTDDKVQYYMWCEQMAKLQMLKLAIQTGYSHNDFHQGNLLINPDYEGMYDNLNGKVMIIDFGLSSKLSPSHIKQIKNLYDKNEFHEALQIFEGLERSDGLVIKDYPSHYGWLYDGNSVNENNKTVNESGIYNMIIEKLIKKENKSIDERVRIFREKHDENPSKYPLLPLSNAIKNHFFQGMIEYEDDHNNKSRKNNSHSSQSRSKGNSRSSQSRSKGNSRSSQSRSKGNSRSSQSRSKSNSPSSQSWW